jgi:AcrR family transcriptional regulator
MAQKRRPDQNKLKTDPRAKIAAAALDLAEKKGWPALTFGDIAKKAKLRLADIEKHFSDIWDIVLWILQGVEAEVEKEVSEYMGSSWRDNLMEILMTRLDIAARHRGAFVHLAQNLPQHPGAMKRLMKPGLKTVKKMMTLAGMPKSMLHPPMVAAFSFVYLSVVHTWTKDDTADSTKTMAAIDKRLGYFETLAGYMQCKKPGAFKKAG